MVFPEKYGDPVKASNGENEPGFTQVSGSLRM